jgi:hypothetical protein
MAPNNENPLNQKTMDSYFYQKRNINIFIIIIIIIKNNRINTDLNITNLNLLIM